MGMSRGRRLLEQAGRLRYPCRAAAPCQKTYANLLQPDSMPADSPSESAPSLDCQTVTCSTCESQGDTARTDAADSDPPCYCRLERLCNTLGKMYALQILGVLRARGSLRYSEVETAVHATSSATVTARLDELTATDLVERRSYDEVPPRVEYSLTPRGQTLTERLQPLVEWVTRSNR